MIFNSWIHFSFFQTALYSIILICVFLWIPFVYFYYEERDDNNVNKCSVSVHLSFATHSSVNCWDVVHILKWFHLNIVASSRQLAPLHLLFLFHWKSHKPSQSTHVKVDFINKIGCFLSSFSFNIISNNWIIYDSLLITSTLLCSFD